MLFVMAVKMSFVDFGCFFERQLPTLAEVGVCVRIGLVPSELVPSEVASEVLVPLVGRQLEELTQEEVPLIGQQEVPLPDQEVSCQVLGIVPYVAEKKTVAVGSLARFVDEVEFYQ